MSAQKADIRLLVGLGNPGANYHLTRHNAGFWLLDQLAEQANCPFRLDKRFQGETIRCTIEGKEVWLLKPMTFMNKSGQSVAALANFFKIEATQILVMHDELDLSPGDNRLKLSGGHGGHNGLRDIINHLGKDFYRLRIGIGHPGDRNLVVNYVLKAPSKADMQAIEQANQRTLEVIPNILCGDISGAMQQLHTKN